jgi:hypothetical protein
MFNRNMYDVGLRESQADAVAEQENETLASVSGALNFLGCFGPQKSHCRSKYLTIRDNLRVWYDSYSVLSSRYRQTTEEAEGQTSKPNELQNATRARVGIIFQCCITHTSPCMQLPTLIVFPG